MVSGAIEQVCVFIEKAHSMKIKINENPLSTALGASSVFQNTSTTDAQAVSLLNLAGEVMRGHRVFPLSKSPKVSATDHSELQTVFMEFIVNALAKEVGEINFDLAGLVARRLDLIPQGITVMLTGCGREHNPPPAELLDIGQRLLDGQTGEADLRRPMGRLYYAAYHHGSRFASDLPSWGDESLVNGGVHARLSRCLTDPSITREDERFFKSKSLGICSRQCTLSVSRPTTTSEIAFLSKGLRSWPRRDVTSWLFKPSSPAIRSFPRSVSITANTGASARTARRTSATHINTAHLLGVACRRVRGIREKYFVQTAMTC